MVFEVQHPMEKVKVLRNSVHLSDPVARSDRVLVGSSEIVGSILMTCGDF